MSALGVIVLSAPGCSLCEQAKAVLARVGRDYDLEVEECSIESERGGRLAQEHRVLFPPGVLLDGETFSYGRLSERKLRRELQRRNTRPAG